jgi:hypothetical protein
MFAFIKHTLWAMVKGFVITGVVAAVVCFGAVLVAIHHLSLDLYSVFAGVITLLAAFLGSAFALIYHLSHIEEISHTLRRVRERQQAERQQAGAR